MDGRFDELLLGLAQKHQGIEALWYTIMSFYERRTDLFHIKETADDPKGFKPGGAEDMLRKQFSHFQARYLERAQPHLLATNHKVLEGRGRTAGGGYTGGSTAAGAPTRAGASPSVPRALPAPGVTASSPSSQPSAAAAAGAGAAAAASSAPIPNGVGASPLEGGDPGQWLRKEERKGDNVIWNQSPSEVNMEITVERCTKHDIKVEIAPRKVCVKRKGEVLIEGRLKDKVNTEESTWHLSDGKVVVLSLEKIRPLFWESLFETPETAS